MPEALRVPDYVRFNRVEGDIVLVDLRKGMYYSLDTLASRIWEVIAEGGTVEVAVAAVLAEYEGTEQAVQTDVAELVQLWRSKELLTLA